MYYVIKKNQKNGCLMHFMSNTEEEMNIGEYIVRKIKRNKIRISWWHPWSIQCIGEIGELLRRDVAVAISVDLCHHPLDLIGCDGAKLFERLSQLRRRDLSVLVDVQLRENALYLTFHRHWGSIDCVLLLCFSTSLCLAPIVVYAFIICLFKERNIYK